MRTFARKSDVILDAQRAIDDAALRAFVAGLGLGVVSGALFGALVAVLVALAWA